MKKRFQDRDHMIQTVSLVLAVVQLLVELLRFVG